MISELNFILDLQIKQMREGRFDCQYKYLNGLLKNFGIKNAKQIKTHMVTNAYLDLDEEEF